MKMNRQRSGDAVQEVKLFEDKHQELSIKEDEEQQDTQLELLFKAEWVHGQKTVPKWFVRHTFHFRNVPMH